MRSVAISITLKNQRGLRKNLPLNEGVTQNGGSLFLSDDGNGNLIAMILFLNIIIDIFIPPAILRFIV